LPLQRADEEMVLVIHPDLSLMGDAVDVDLLIVGLALGSCHGGGRHNGSESAVGAPFTPVKPWSSPFPCWTRAAIAAIERRSGPSGGSIIRRLHSQETAEGSFATLRMSIS